MYEWVFERREACHAGLERMEHEKLTPAQTRATEQQLIKHLPGREHGHYKIDIDTMKQRGNID